ncbi:MAG TPA: CsgG/HfaB family protein [Geomonas sp.]
MQHRLLLLVCVGTSLICGCATPGKESYRIGLELEQQNRLEESVSLLEEAVVKASGNSEYSEACQRVKSVLISQHLNRAKAVLDSKPLTFGQLQQASSSVEKALKLSRDDKEAVQLNDEIGRQMNEMIQASEKLNIAANIAIEAKEWKYAIDSLKEVQGFYPAYPGLSAKLITTADDAVAYYLNEAESYKNAEDFPAAINMLILGKGIQPSSQRIAEVLSELRSMNSPESHLTKAAEFAKQNEWEKTLAHIKKARAQNPGADIIARMDKLQNDGAAFFMEKSLRYSVEADIYGAYENLSSAIDLKADIGQDPKYAEFVVKLNTALQERADAYESAGKLGNALAWYGKAHHLAGGGQRGLFAKIQALRDKIRQRVVKKIAIMDFTSPASTPDAGRLVTDSLLSNLTKNASGDVKIFARDVLGALLKEIELGQAGLYDIQSAKKAGKLKGTDILIFGNVNQCSVEKSVEDGLKMVNAVVGKKSVVNPAYQAWLAANPKPSKQAIEGAPPQLNEEEVREIVKYKVATHKKNANVIISFRLIDVEEGEVVLSKKLTNNELAVGTYSEGVEFAGIPFKELKLPSDSAMLEQVVEKTIAELGYGVLSRFQNLQIVYANSAEMQKKKGDYEGSIEKYVDATLVEEVKNIATQISENSRNEIDRLLKVISQEKAAAEKSAPEGAALEKTAHNPAIDPVGNLTSGGTTPVITEAVRTLPVSAPDARPVPAPDARPVPAPDVRPVSAPDVRPVPDPTVKSL